MCSAGCKYDPKLSALCRYHLKEIAGDLEAQQVARISFRMNYRALCNKQPRPVPRPCDTLQKKKIEKETRFRASLCKALPPGRDKHKCWDSPGLGQKNKKKNFREGSINFGVITQTSGARRGRKQEQGIQWNTRKTVRRRRTASCCRTRSSYWRNSGARSSGSRRRAPEKTRAGRSGA